MEAMEITTLSIVPSKGDVNFANHVEFLRMLCADKPQTFSWFHAYGDKLKGMKLKYPLAYFQQTLALPPQLRAELSADADVPHQVLLEYSLKHRPENLAPDDLQLFVETLMKTPCSRRVPVVIRLENMVERCGVLSTLWEQLKPELLVAHKDGTLATIHFGADIRYQSGARTNVRRGTRIPETPLTAAVVNVVRDRLREARFLAYVRLLGGVWPYTDYLGERYWFDIIMNHLCCFANDGTLIPRLKRAIYNRPNGAPSDHAVPLNTFQLFGSGQFSYDMFIVGMREGKNPWLAKGNSRRFGKFVSALGAGAYASVALFESDQADVHGRTKFAVRAQALHLLMDSTHAHGDSDGLHVDMTDVLAGTLIARVLTERVKPYDGYVEDGFMHAASITRIIDHQMVLGKLDEMIPGMKIRNKQHRGALPWQLEVFEYVDGSKLETVHKASALNGDVGTFGDMWYRSVVAHVVATIRSFEDIKFTHADLTSKNVMVSAMPRAMKHKAQTAVYFDPSGGTLFVPFAYTNGWLIKVIDYSLSSVSVPSRGTVARTPLALRATGVYHPALDLHLFGCWMLHEVGVMVREINADDDDELRYAKLKGITSGTIDMLLDMLITERCIMNPERDLLKRMLIHWSPWDSRGQAGIPSPINLEEAIELFRDTLSRLREKFAILRDAMRAFEESRGRVSQQSRAEVTLSTAMPAAHALINLSVDAAMLSYYCTFPETSSLTAVRDFLMSEHMAMFRQPLEGGLVIMNA